MNMIDKLPLPEALRKSLKRLECNGFRVVRVVPNWPDLESGVTAFLCKRTPTGLLLAQAEVNADGSITNQQPNTNK